jgi:hypothetical protein
MNQSETLSGRPHEYLANKVYVRRKGDDQSLDIKLIRIYQVAESDPASMAEELKHGIEFECRITNDIVIVDASRGTPSFLVDVLRDYEFSGYPVAVYPTPDPESTLGRALRDIGKLRHEHAVLFEDWSNNRLESDRDGAPQGPSHWHRGW